MLALLKAVRKQYPGKDIWCYTGYDYEKDLLVWAGGGSWGGTESVPFRHFSILSMSFRQTGRHFALFCNANTEEIGKGNLAVVGEEVALMKKLKKFLSCFR